MKNDWKKILIIIGCGILIFVSGIALGRYLRLSKVTVESATIDSSGQQLVSDTRDLHNQLEQRAAETEQIQRDIERITVGINECVGVAASVREGLAVISRNTSSSNAIVREIAKRVGEYEERIAQLETTLKLLTTSTDIE